MATIMVTATGGDTYEVTVKEGSGSTSHNVTATVGDLQRYGGGVPAEQLIEASFEFLLEREPKEAIMGRFGLPVIERYFPEYPRVIRQKVGA